MEKCLSQIDNDFKLPEDHCSYANPKHVTTTHIDIDWTVNFSEKTLSGSVLLYFNIKDCSINQLTLDSRELNITKVICEESGQSLNFEMPNKDPNLGSKVTISIPSEQLSKKLLIRIFYSTSPSSSGIQWLNPSQTSGKKLPFLFTQCQAIHARSLLPCQDTPRVKATYKATVKCDSKLVALMGALKEGESEVKDEFTTFRFRQPVAIPAYLIAIVVGDLVSKELGPRSKVWAEKEVVEKAADEFADTEKMLCIAESLCGPYVWQEYDLLVLPPSFPYGGMENPCLTFVTPTLLAGDRSLADVIAHEICHSWTGNLITNCNWEHFWLNEGFTVFIERKIQERLNGKPARHLSAIEGWGDLKYAVETKGKDHPYTCLIPELRGIDPDDAYTTVPYEKGHAFLWYLEELLGGPGEFEPFLKAYLEKFQLQSIDSEVLKNFLGSYFSGKSSELNSIDWKAWWYTPGMPPYEPKFDTSLVDSCLKLSKTWGDWNIEEECPFSKTDLSQFSSQQVIVWLSKMLEVPLVSEKVKKMDELYEMSKFRNCEIKFRWLRLCVKVRWLEKLEEVFNFINSQGRMKYVLPIYRDLYAWEDAREKAITNFNATKDSMMYVAVQNLTKILQL